MLCAVEDCANPKAKTRYFPFPKDPKICKTWQLFCRRKDKIDIKREKICLEHFLSGDFERDLPYELGVYSKPRPLKLRPGSVPSVYSKNVEDFAMDFHVNQKVDVSRQHKARTVAQRKQVVDALIAEYDEEQAQERMAANLQQLTDSTVSDMDDDDEPDEEIVQVVVDAEAYLTALERENTDLRRENFQIKLAAEKDAVAIDKLQKQLDKSDKLYDELLKNLARVFSTAQIQKLQSGKRVVWHKRDLNESCALYSTSPCVYNMLLQKGYPLPSPRTLQHWDANERGQLLQQEAFQPDRQVQSEDHLESCDLVESIEITHVDHNYVN